MNARGEGEVATRLTVRIVTDDHEFAEMRPVWTDVLARTHGGHAFLTWEWAFTWWRHFGAPDDLHIVVVEDAGEVIALAPLLRMRTGLAGLGLEVYLPIGHENADYGGILLGARPREAGRAILDHLEQLVASSNAVVELIRVPGECPILALLDEHVAGSSHLAFDGIGNLQCLYVDFAEVDDPAGHVARLAKRHDAPREYRRLARNHATKFDYHVDWPVSDAMNLLFELHERRWATKGDAYGGLFAEASTRSFAIDAVEALAAAGIARLSFVTADGTPVAGSLGYEYGGIFSWHKYSFDPAYSSYSPGHILIMLLLEQAVATGLREYNFGRADESYKERWVNSRRRLATVLLRRPGVRGSLQRRLHARAATKRRRRRAAADGRQ